MKKKILLGVCITQNKQIIYWIQENTPLNANGFWAHQRLIPHKLMLRNGDYLNVDISHEELDDFREWAHSMNPSAVWSKYLAI